MKDRLSTGISSAAAVGGVISILIVAAVAGLAYFQFDVAPTVYTSTTTTSETASGLPPAGTYINVTIPNGAASPPGPGYAPATITLVLGKNSTVAWTNDDAAIHTVTATDNSFNSGNMNQGDVYVHQFTTSGTFTYRCIYHSWMQGTIIVKSG